ncbi:multinuclear nonheme iron-dependent oxidase [Streptomyces narbonensis]|uniref:multinuclear nonheme iron-dependent oxidase n=1 Tax=Streptomyces narbonensis TaxID=67333 RepID=UPI0033D5AB36
MTELGIGIGWRPEIAEAVEALPGVDWVEVVAENICADHLPDSLTRLRERGVTVVPHGVSLGLGGADRPDPARLAALGEKAVALGAPLVTEHIAFVRAGGPLTASPLLEAGHLLPVPRTRDALDVLCENVRIAQDALPVPLALENIAALIAWPGEELTEGQFLAELVERTGVRLLIDVANLHTNHVNRGEDPAKALSELPVEAIAYVHVAGGVERDGVWHDTHAHPVPRAVLDVLADLASRVSPPGVLLERDDDFPPAEELAAELTVIRETVAAGGTATATSGGTVRPRGARSSVLASRRTPLLIGAGARVSGGPMPGAPVVRDPAREPASAREPAPVRESAPAQEPVSVSVKASAPAQVSVPVQVSVPAQTPAPGQESAPREGARQRVGLTQAALLSALVAGTPAPEGFDSRRLGVQSRALAAKRAGVVAKVAPELPEILGTGFRPAFLAYARTRPMTGGYRRDALDFAEHLLLADRPEDPAARRRLTEWWQDRSGSRPPGRAVRLARAARHALTRR